MNRSVAFLRGINVAGRRVSSETLVQVFRSLGFSGTETFLASGNLIFDSEEHSASEQQIEQALRSTLGYEVPTMLRSATEVLAIVNRQPFAREALVASHASVQVSLLRDVPSAEDKERVLTLATEEDLLVLHERELYWLPRTTMSESTLDVARIERILGTQTRRALRTLQRLALKYLHSSDKSSTT